MPMEGNSHDTITTRSTLRMRRGEAILLIFSLVTWPLFASITYKACRQTFQFLQPTRFDAAHARDLSNFDPHTPVSFS